MLIEQLCSIISIQGEIEKHVARYKQCQKKRGRNE
jgi:hypothetical protein